MTAYKIMLPIKCLEMQFPKHKKPETSQSATQTCSMLTKEQ